MAWLKVPGDTETPELERITRPYREAGTVPAVVAVMKPSPKALKAVLRMNDAVTFGGSILGRRREEMIAVTVSALNACYYWLISHAGFLREFWDGGERGYFSLVRGMWRCGEERAEQRPAEAVAAARLRLRGLDLTLADEAMLTYVVALGMDPGRMGAGEVQALREAGFSEREIHDIVMVVSCFSFMNRLADGTGVTVQPSHHKVARELLGQEALSRHLAWGRRA
jgi:alkylhydroperoxidase family enzyme